MSCSTQGSNMVKLTEKLVLGRARADSLHAVKNLNCWASDLTDVSILRQIDSLEVLNVSANSICTLQDFSHCPNLRELYLRKNDVKDLNEVLHLKDLTQLRLLWLSDNPCCPGAEDDKYRLTVLRALPNLLKLDNKVVTPEEVERAKEEGGELSFPEESTTKTSPRLQNISADSTEEIKHSCNNQPEKPEDVRKLHLKRIPSENDDHSEPVINTANSGEESLEDSMMAETNRLRKELGLKPLTRHPTTDKSSSQRHDTRLRSLPNSRNKAPPPSTSRQPNNILTATLALVQELDEDSLWTLQGAIQERLRQSYDTTESTSLQEPDEGETLDTQRSELSNGSVDSGSNSDQRIPEKT